MATAYTDIVFNAYEQPSGRWVKIDMSRQAIGPPIGQPYTGTPVLMEKNPWARGGLPAPEEAASPEDGYIGLESTEFTFHNVPVKASVDDTTLHEIIELQQPDQYRWNIRMFTTTTVVAGVPVFAAEPDFWGWIESSEITGKLYTEDKTWNSYKLTARNILSSFEAVNIDLWLNGTSGSNGYLQHATYDKVPTGGVWIDGIRMEYIFQHGGLQDRTVPVNIGGGAPGSRFFRLVDVIYSLGAAAGITRPVNDIGAGTGSIPMTWDFISIANPTPTETVWAFDDLCIWSGLYWDPGSGYRYDQKWTFFDPEKLTGASLWNVGTALEALKVLILPFGLTAKVAVNASGQRYLEVREIDGSAATAPASNTILKGAELIEGENAAFGLRVAIINGGEIIDGESGDHQLQCPYLGATRLRAWPSGRWVASPGDTDDLACLYDSIYVWDAANVKAHSVFKIIPRRDGVERITQGPGMTNHLGSSAPECYPDWTNMEGIPAIHEAGSVVGKAMISYYINTGADPDTDPVGVYRRFMKRLRWAETGIVRVMLGVYRTVFGTPWTVRRRMENPSQDFTEFEGERGSYNATP